MRPAWRAGFTEETRSTEVKPLQERYIAHGADFMALQLCRYAAYPVTHVKRVAAPLSPGFVLLTRLFNAYNPEGVFPQMERNPVLSAIAHAEPGELNSEFWFQLVELGGLPLLGVVVHPFPSPRQSVFQWIAPGRAGDALREFPDCSTKPKVSQTSGSDALYVAWKIEPADEIAARRVSLQLRRGEDQNLYRLRSWMIAGGEARALLAPAAPLERIAEAIWERPANAICTEWIESADLCAQLAREIETAPVSMGLVKRPEQWPFSSAAID